MNLNSEYGKRCGLCHKNKQSRSYPFKINDKFIKLCKECWDKQDTVRTLEIIENIHIPKTSKESKINCKK